MIAFKEFFERATGLQPFPYQEKFATDDTLDDIITAPTGAGKTAAVMVGWLWRRFHGNSEIKNSTPIRLTYCLPMRVLVEQSLRCAAEWLTKVDLVDQVGLTQLMGGEDANEWYLHPEKPAIIIGTQDMLLSRAMNRGYGMSRYRWPIDFALLNNDTLWVLDEVQLMGSGLATTAQLQAFRTKFRTMGGCKSVWMSATFQKKWLATVDFKSASHNLQELQLSESDKSTPTFEKRLTARKSLARLQIVDQPKAGKKSSKKSAEEEESEKFEEIAKKVQEFHQLGSLTLVIMNTVDRAKKLYKMLTKDTSVDSGNTAQNKPELLLIHSRFRPPERAAKIKKLLAPIPEQGRVVVTTQVVEAGVDVSATVLFTDAAPWASLVQRFGRCNRKGEDLEAKVFWMDIFQGQKKTQESAAPYDEEDVRIAIEQLRKLTDVSPQSLENHIAGLTQEEREALFPHSTGHVIRSKDIIELFDTTPDIAGNDIDISRFIREGNEFDVQVFWRETDKEHQLEEEKAPSREELCSVPISGFREFLKSGKRAYLWDFLEKRWKLQTKQAEVFPGRIYLVPAAEGGYSSELGWDESFSDKVKTIGFSTELPDSNDADKFAVKPDRETISEHTNKVIEQLDAIIRGIAGLLSSDDVETLRMAAIWHDRGKAHEVFQEAIKGNPTGASGDWAKAPEIGRYKRPGFRHELASALAMLSAGIPDLSCYLAAAHHGKVRLSIRSLPIEKKPPHLDIRFARGIWDDDHLPEVTLGSGEKAPGVTLSLEPMELGLSDNGEPSWTERMVRLRDSLGPFKLAFLEAILRAADMRASRMNGPKGGNNA